MSNFADFLRGLTKGPVDAIEFIGLSSLAGASLGISTWNFNDIRGLIEIIYPKIPHISLLLSTIFWYFRYKKSVISEIGLIDSAFEGSNIPTDEKHIVKSIKWYNSINPIGYCIAILFGILVYFSYYIKIYLIFSLFLSIMDLIGSSTTLQNLNKFLSEYKVIDDIENRLVISGRREAIIKYYFGNMTLQRICIIFLVTLSSLIYYYETQDGVGDGRYHYVIYYIMTINILAGEYIISQWRIKRDRAMRQ